MTSLKPELKPQLKSNNGPQLSIIIPTLNEKNNLSILLDNLTEQQGLIFETIIVDGGSTDNTLNICKNFSHNKLLNLRTMSSHPGRAIQMNCAVNNTTAKDLLFLHADSLIDNSHLLHNALNFINTMREKTNRNSVAGHFGLRFLTNENNNYPTGYYFYESKTVLNRPDCINGDQGYLLAKEFFDDLGGFDESHPYMEDARLSKQIFNLGHWITLPGHIYTSARRFEVEGLKKRQTLNSFMCNFEAIGLHEFFDAASNVYQTQDHTTALKLKPFLRLINRLMFKDGLQLGVIRWYRTGAYVALNAWQLAYLLDCRKNIRQKFSPGQGPANFLAVYDKWLAIIFRTAPIKAITAGLTFIWFYSLLLKSILLER